MLALLLKEGYPPILLRSIDKKRYFEVIENYQLKSKKEEYYHFMSMMLMRSFKMVLENRQKNVNKKDLLTIFLNKTPN